MTLIEQKKSKRVYLVQSSSAFQAQGVWKRVEFSVIKNGNISFKVEALNHRNSTEHAEDICDTVYIKK